MPDYQVKSIKDIPYDVVLTVADDLSSTTALQTQPDYVDSEGAEIENPYEGFTAVKKYRFNLPPYNPETTQPFANEDEIMDFVLSSRENYFSDWFDDPVEEESE